MDYKTKRRILEKRKPWIYPDACARILLTLRKMCSPFPNLVAKINNELDKNASMIEYKIYLQQPFYESFCFVVKLGKYWSAIRCCGCQKPISPYWLEYAIRYGDIRGHESQPCSCLPTLLPPATATENLELEGAALMSTIATSALAGIHYWGRSKDQCANCARQLLILAELIKMAALMRFALTVGPDALDSKACAAILQASAAIDAAARMISYVIGKKSTKDLSFFERRAYKSKLLSRFKASSHQGQFTELVGRLEAAIRGCGDAITKLRINFSFPGTKINGFIMIVARVINISPRFHEEAWRLNLNVKDKNGTYAYGGKQADPQGGYTWSFEDCFSDHSSWSVAQNICLYLFAIVADVR
eukprot:TRINITY_DN654_c0_g1_i1.p1 TRINITY_DN654_c0_g1~~TRINITY_DN654_c0_g1_i1.p1  ORF type:complete len:360 (+),score=53.70 TRINITY_DN654_c0_g1_i1:524-1603(+)